MNLDLFTCVGGMVEVPDMRGGSECYSGNESFGKLLITQTPVPGSLIGQGQTIINVLTEDGNGNATLCTHYVNVSDSNPPPVIMCPQNIVTWLLSGGWEVPDFTKTVKIEGGCTVRDDLIITQSPEAGSLIITAGVHPITISAEDEFGQIATCGTFTVTLKAPSNPRPPVTPPDPPVDFPPWVYDVGLLAYWPLDDIGFLKDASVLYGNTSPRDLSNLGVQSVSNTALSCYGARPGPIFGQGSAYFDRTLFTLARADDSLLKLAGGQSWTIRFMFKLEEQDQFGSDLTLISKKIYGSVDGGYRIMLTRFGGATHYVYPQMYTAAGVSLTCAPVPISLNQWTVLVLTFDVNTGTITMYKNGAQSSTTTSAGFLMSGDASPFQLGDAVAGARAKFYLDGVGIWQGAWTPSRVLEDFHLINCIT